MVFDLLQLTGGLILCFGNAPQIVQIIKTKSVEDLNLKTFILIPLGVLFMEIYAINLVANGSGLMFLITNTMALILGGIVAGLIIKYRED